MSTDPPVPNAKKSGGETPLRCKAPGCPRSRAFERKLCHRHIYRWKHYKLLEFSHPLMKTLTCVITGCANRCWAKYLCRSHYEDQLYGRLKHPINLE